MVTLTRIYWYTFPREIYTPYEEEEGKKERGGREGGREKEIESRLEGGANFFVEWSRRKLVCQLTLTPRPPNSQG